ncbi:MAG: hypothetical protein Q8912_08615 [Bacillota bacterium]|nr:hypothetical protein [Bacillota bacterium]MDP4159693.1 hypothetical protein [Bacillota bacterium]
MKNKNTLISLLFATGSVVALTVILGNLGIHSSSQSTSRNLVSPSASQGQGVSPGISYEYDFNDDDDDDKDKRDDEHTNKGKKRHRNGVYSSSSPLESDATSIPSASSSLNSAPNQQNPRQSNTQAS